MRSSKLEVEPMSNNRLPHLFQSGNIGSLQLKNRMVMAPMVMGYRDEHGHVTSRMIDYYAERARGGVGLVVTEAAYPRPTGHPGRLTIATDDAIPGFKTLADAIHAAGAKVVMQLNPARGRVDEVEQVSASDVELYGVKTRALTIPEIEQAVQYLGGSHSQSQNGRLRRHYDTWRQWLSCW
ncbi:hypothetical protein ACFLVN_01875 [Chloroflexota bacterium]